MTDVETFEKDADSELPDPDSTPIRDRKVVTQPYDMAIESIVSQVKNDVLFLRPLSSRPNFQRQYVWTDKLASKLVESVLLNVPIPPCYLSENAESELDVIDGQQRIYSLYRYINNEFALSSLEAMTELNGKRFFELPSKEQRKIKTHTIKCVVVTNESHPEIKFDVFERLNTNTMPLNPQELRNCVSRGTLNDLVGELSYDARWLSIRGRKLPDKRLADEEVILRFFAFRTRGLGTYKTPLKYWLNDAARLGRRFDEATIESLRASWIKCITNSLAWFKPEECFRRPGSTSINRALFDLIMHSANSVTEEVAPTCRGRFRREFMKLCKDDDFTDLISRAVDHKSRTESRFRVWDAAMVEVLK